MDQPPQLQPPKTFYLGDLLFGPLNFAILIYSLFPNPLLSQVDTNSSQWTKLLFCYLISLFAFPLLSAIVFTRVASLKRLFTTQLWVFLAMVLYNAAFLEFGPRALASFTDTTPVMGRIMSALSILFVSVPLLHADDVMLWRLASLPEPINGAVAAMEKSKLQLIFTLSYLLASFSILAVACLLMHAVINIVRLQVTTIPLVIMWVQLEKFHLIQGWRQESLAVESIFIFRNIFHLLFSNQKLNM